MPISSKAKMFAEVLERGPKVVEGFVGDKNPVSRVRLVGLT